jgi:3-oxoacyl-[acyl-carrier protein] reductase
MMLLQGKVAVVTGGARGIGADICRVLAREGAAVAINYAHSSEAAERVAAEITGNGGQARAFAADVRDAQAVETMIQDVVQHFGRLDGVINNAIAGRQEGSLEVASWDDYSNAFDFGCKGVVNTVRAARPIMQQQGGGRIVNIVTELWNMAPANWSVYLAGKGAMVGLSRSLAEELGPDNITVNMVAPGWMADEKVDTSSAGSQGFAKGLPLRRHGSAQEIGNACAFFLSELSSYVTGAYLPVTGGRVTQMGA